MNKTMFAGTLALSLAVPCMTFAETGVKASSTTPKAILDVACISSALDARDTAIGAAYTKENTAIISALNTRTAELKASYAMATKAERQTSRSAAWKKWEAAVKGAKGVFKTEKDAAWKSFDTGMKACKTTNVEGAAAEHVNG